MATKTLSLRIDEELIERIDAVAEGRSRNAVIKELIEAGLKAAADEEADEAKAAATLETLLEKIAAIDEKVDGADERITQRVVDGVSEQNNALFRDTTTQMTTQMTSAVFPQFVNEMNKKLLDEFDKRIEEMRSQPIALPESQVQVEAEPITPALPAETHEEEADPETMGFFDKMAYNRMTGLGYRVVVK